MTESEWDQRLYDLVGFCALGVLWLCLLGVIAWLGIFAIRQQRTDADSLRRQERARAALGRAHQNVLGTGGHPGAERDELRRHHRSSAGAR